MLVLMSKKEKVTLFLNRKTGTPPNTKKPPIFRLEAFYFCSLQGAFLELFLRRPEENSTLRFVANIRWIDSGPTAAQFPFVGRLVFFFLIVFT